MKIGLDDFFAKLGCYRLETYAGYKRYPLAHPRFKTLACWYQKWARRQRSGGDQGLVKSLADEILKTDHFAVDPGGHLYIFASGCYRPRGEQRILRAVKRLLDLNADSARWSSHRAREVAEYIKVDTLALWDHPRPDVLNLTNGLFNLTTGMLYPHDPGHLSPIQLPVKYNAEATCPLWDTFVARVLPEDCQTIPFELAASAMRGDVSDQQAILTVGPGDNGKSTLLDALSEFLGRENVACLALQRLEIDKFAAVRLMGKLANICADLPGDQLTSTSTFKALTGGDRLTAERKFQGSFEFTPFARLIFSTNHYPQSRDASHAFFRRWLVIPFEAVLDPNEKIPGLSAQLAAPGELSGVLSKALATLPGMRARGGFTHNESMQSAMTEFREMTDPLAAWLDRYTVVRPEAFVSKKDLAILYNAACSAASRPPISAKAFHTAVRRLRPTVKEGQRTIQGEMKDVFLGLALTNKNAQLATPPSAHSAHSAYFPQISLEEVGSKDNENKSIKIGDELNELSQLIPQPATCDDLEVIDVDQG